MLVKDIGSGLKFSNITVTLQWKIHSNILYYLLKSKQMQSVVKIHIYKIITIQTVITVID